MPEPATGKLIDRITSRFVAPKLYAPSFRSLGTMDKNSELSEDAYDSKGASERQTINMIRPGQAKTSWQSYLQRKAAAVDGYRKEYVSVPSLQEKMESASKLAGILATQSDFDITVKWAEKLSDMMTGNNALGFTYGDPAALAKALAEFAKTNDKFIIKGGALGEKILNPAQIKALASLPSREVMLSTLLGAMNALPTNMVRVLNAVPQKLVYALSAIRDQKEAA